MKSQSREDIELGKFLSLILRHRPEIIGIKLDDFGWADVEELITATCKSGRKINRDILNRIVEENNKQRYSFNDGKTKIRANQGHSVEVDVELEEKIPPQFLYHGTAERFAESILSTGIRKQSRQYVHLSSDKETARTVGKRHGKPVIFIINTGQMAAEGFKFYLSKNLVWLTDFVPVKFISMYREK